MKLAPTLRLVTTVVAVGLLASACSGSLDEPSAAGSAAASTAASAAASAAASGDAAAAGDTIKIGYVTPLTGPLAAFGEGDQWVVDQMTAYFAENPIQAGGKSYGVEIVMKDSQSDPKRAGELAGELINTDGVDILMAHATPETTVPVSAQCEANATPCITADTPWQPWVAGMGGNPGDPATSFQWAYHFFWGLEDIAAVNMEVWDAVDTNKKVGAIYANDADGQAFTDEAHGYPAIVGPAGYQWNNPGLYPVGTQDFSSQISAFKSNDDQIVTGARHPRGNKAWPRIGIFAQRGKNRPNRIGVTVCEVVAVKGRTLEVKGLDAIDGTPVLDIKPVMSGFAPRGEVREPDWAREIMAAYW